MALERAWVKPGLPAEELSLEGLRMTGRARIVRAGPVDELTLEAVRRGEVSLADLRIHPETLERQAEVAAGHAQPAAGREPAPGGRADPAPRRRGAGHLRRAAPGPLHPEQLTALAGSLAGRGLPRCAALLTEAAEVYARRGLSA